MQPSTEELNKIQLSVDELVAIYPSNTPFKVFDAGFYVYNELMTGERPPAIWDKMIQEAKAGSKYYLLFGRQYTHDGSFSKVWVDVRLPDQADCLDDELINKIIKSIGTSFKINLGEGVFKAQELAIDYAKNLIYKVEECGCEGLRNGCSTVPSFELVNIDLLTAGFRKKEITLGDEHSWTNGTQDIYDYVQKDVIIDNEIYNIPDQIKDGKADFDNGVTLTNEDTTLVSSPLSGHVYVLDINSFDVEPGQLESKWTAVRNISLTLDYLECWVVLTDETGKSFLYSKFTLGQSSIADIPDDDLPLSFDSKGDFDSRGITLSPLGAALKFLGNAALDAFFQGLINYLITPEIDTWEEVLNSISIGSALWEGLSSLIPWKVPKGWKAELGQNALKAIGGAFSAVVEKSLKDENYTAGDGFRDFVSGFGSSFLSQLVLSSPQTKAVGKVVVTSGIKKLYLHLPFNAVRNILLKAIKLIVGDGGTIKKIYDQYVSKELYEVFYRGISQDDYDELIKSFKLNGTGETSTSPNFEFSETYGDVRVKFFTKKGTISKLIEIGRNAETGATPNIVKEHFGDFIHGASGWGSKFVVFKPEPNAIIGSSVEHQVNILLGKEGGKGLDIFNKALLYFEIQ